MSVPTVATNTATNIEKKSATLNGYLTADGGEACACGFEWGFDTSYGNTYEVGSRVTGESFNHALTNLVAGAKFNFRAYATNSEGTSYGINRTFKTESKPQPDRPPVNKYIVTLEAMRNIEITFGGRVFIAKGGDAAWESRFHR